MNEEELAQAMLEQVTRSFPYTTQQGDQMAEKILDDVREEIVSVQKQAADRIDDAVLYLKERIRHL